MSQAGSSVGGSSSETRIPASTSSLPRYVTVVPSNSKPSTGEPSGASALYASIPPRRAHRRTGIALLPRQEVEHVVVEGGPAIVGLEDNADCRQRAGVPDDPVVQYQVRTRQVEERREIRCPRHDVAVAAHIEQKDVVRERVERRRELRVPLGDDPAVEIEQARRRAAARAHLPKPAPRAGRELRARYTAIRARNAVVDGLWLAVPIDRAGTPRIRERLVELPWQHPTRLPGAPDRRLDRIAQTVVLQPLRGAPHRLDVLDASPECLLHERRVVPPRTEVLIHRV